MSSQDVASILEQPPPKDLSTTRGYSDSVVPGCRASKDKEQNFYDLNGPVQSDLAAPVYPDGAESTMPPRVKARANLQLPCFKTLGILSRIPDPLFTPPDESITPRPISPPCLISRSSSYPPTNMPNTPSPDRGDLTETLCKVKLSNNVSTSEGSSSFQQPMAPGEPQRTSEEPVTEATSQTNLDADSDAAPAEWIVDAINAAVATIDHSAANVVFVLCHSQPCPLPNIGTGPETTTAFYGMLSRIQERIDSSDRYIHVTHAIPVKFSMGQIPNSPATTPSMHNHSTAPTDYFNLPSNVFSNAVIAISHQDALESAVPCSPRPVVPPASVNISLLERYIPPSSAEEYLNLFQSQGPSVLVDRLVELSSSSGSLIFIYPTAAGAQTFANAYLGPLLHPHLRTMCSIHNLSMDFGAGIGSIAAVEQMLSYEAMLRKIQLLLRKLGRNSSSTRAAPKFSLIQSSKKCIDIERKTWSEWWANQEAQRMRTVVDRYLKRGAMLPARIAGQEVTAAALVQEVLDGVRENRQYAEYDLPREGIEVGVFVIKRTA